MSGDHNQYQKAKSWSEARQEVSYVQLVDDECDRIVWRNQSFRLPIEWMGLKEEQRKALLDARNEAMEWSARGRIPECSAFAGIAQNLDWVCDQLKEKNHG